MLKTLDLQTPILFSQMLKTLDLQTPILFSHRSLLLSNCLAECNASLQIPNSATSPTNSIFHRSYRIQIQTQNKNPIVSASRGRRRGRAGSQNTIRFLSSLVSLAASNLNLLPPPLDLVLEEIGGGDGGSGGGGPGFWKGFGWEGFDGWRRRRKRKKSNLWLYGFAAIWVLGFLFGEKIESNAIWWGLGFGPFGIAVIRWLDKIDGVQGLVFLGFCLWSFVVGMSFRREELRKWVSEVRVSIPGNWNLRRRSRRKNWRVFFRK